MQQFLAASRLQDKNVTGTTVKFDNGQVRNYKIVYKEKDTDKENTRYVDKIVFWDAIEYPEKIVVDGKEVDGWADLDGDAAKETPLGAPIVWAEYEVKVGYFVEFVTEE